MGHPKDIVQFGIPLPSNDGKYRSRYPNGDWPGIPASAIGAGVTVAASSVVGSGAGGAIASGSGISDAAIAPAGVANVSATASGAGVTRPSTAPSATATGGGGGVGTLSHGQEFTIEGSNFGERPDFNVGNYTWMGHRHMHRGWLDFAGGFPADGSSQALFMSDAFCKGFFPAGTSGSQGYDFQPNPVSATAVTIENGGVSQSGKYMHKVSTGFAQGGYIQLNVVNLTPCDGIVVFKCRAQTNGAKIYRERREDGGGDWFHGSGGQFLDEPGGGWPYNSTAFGDGQLSPTVWKRHEIVKSVALGCQTRIGATVAEFGPFIGDDRVIVTRVPLTTSLQNGRQMNCTWPNSVDPGFFDVSDIYYDQTAARVELWSDEVGTIREVQICRTWTNGQIRIIANRGELSLGPVKIKIFGADDSVLETRDGTLV